MLGGNGCLMLRQISSELLTFSLSSSIVVWRGCSACIAVVLILVCLKSSFPPSGHDFLCLCVFALLASTVDLMQE